MNLLPSVPAGDSFLAVWCDFSLSSAQTVSTTKVICDTAVLHNEFFIRIIQDDTHGECGGTKSFATARIIKGFFFEPEIRSLLSAILDEVLG